MAKDDNGSQLLADLPQLMKQPPAVLVSRRKSSLINWLIINLLTGYKMLKRNIINDS
jgi:hypothetical protein